MALIQRGIITFIDELNLKKGKSISLELLKSIEESRFAIIVFSKNYASSSWCLDELVKIMECRSKYDQTVIPIFYDVDPSVVRKQTDSFAEAFAEHEVKFKDNIEKVQIWKQNLREAGNISGEDLSRRNVPEAPCVKKIVEEIFSNLLRKVSVKGLVGIEDRVKKLTSLWTKEPNAVCFAGIWGMGGIGKTTTARAIFDELVSGFEGGCFLQDVCKHDIVKLQKTLLTKILKLDHVNISDVYEGSTMIRTSLCFKRIILVLDDVNDIKQLNSLAREREWFGRGSRIIITTRDKHLLYEVNEIYEIDTLSDSEATQLFCWHAFKESRPAEDFVQLSYGVVRYACGLPLALEVLGSYLRGRTQDVWESALARLKDSPEDKIFVALKISFEGLNDIQQDIFLDIACFFRGMREDEVKQRLYSFGFHPVDGIDVLIQKALIRISEEKIQMHDLIQEMGWNIVRRKANKDPGRYSRLWDCDDIIDVLTSDTGTDEIKGMVSERQSNVEFSEGVFRSMNKLRLLEVNWGNFWQAPDYLPNTLRWLYWASYPAKSLPRNFKPRNLVSLRLSHSLLLQTPDVSCMPNLEVLNLDYCKELLEVHPSVGLHKKLIDLNLSWCNKLKGFPEIIRMESLEILNLEGSSMLQGFSEIRSNTSVLRIINLGRTEIAELPWSLGRLTNLRELDLHYCDNLKALPDSLFRLQYLEFITMFGCPRLAYIFKNRDGEAVDCFDSQSVSLKREGAENHDGASLVVSLFFGQSC